jgi:hypothetical protein
MQLMSWGVLVLATVLLGSATAALAGTSRKPVRATVAVRDCRPINGRFGYYGNPWCDTGSYRMEDIRFRQNQARLKRLQGQRVE